MAPRRVVLLLLAVVAAASALPTFPSSSPPVLVHAAAHDPRFRDHVVIPVPAAETSGSGAQPPTVDGGGGALNPAIQRTVYNDDDVTAASSAPTSRLQYYDVVPADADAQAEPPTADGGRALNPVIQRATVYDDVVVTATSSAPPPRVQHYDVVVPAAAPTSGADDNELDGADCLFLFYCFCLGFLSSAIFHLGVFLVVQQRRRLISDSAFLMKKKHEIARALAGAAAKFKAARGGN